MCPKLILSCLILYSTLTHVNSFGKKGDNPESSQSGTTAQSRKSKGRPILYTGFCGADINSVENPEPNKIDRRKFSPGRPTMYPLTGDYKDLSHRPKGRPRIPLPDKPEISKGKSKQKSPIVDFDGTELAPRKKGRIPSGSSSNKRYGPDSSEADSPSKRGRGRSTEYPITGDFSNISKRKLGKHPTAKEPSRLREPRPTKFILPKTPLSYPPNCLPNFSFNCLPNVSWSLANTHYDPSVNIPDESQNSNIPIVSTQESDYNKMSYSPDINSNYHPENSPKHEACSSRTSSSSNFATGLGDLNLQEDPVISEDWDFDWDAYYEGNVDTGRDTLQSEISLVEFNKDQQKERISKVNRKY